MKRSIGGKKVGKEKKWILFSSPPLRCPMQNLKALLSSNPTPLPPKSGLKFSLRHRESVEMVHENRGIW